MCQLMVIARSVLTSIPPPSHLYAHPHTRSAPHSRSLTLRPHFSGAIAPVTMVVAMELGIANPVPALNCLVQPSIAWAGE